MKNLLLTTAAALLLLTACSKEESFQQFEEQSADFIYVSNQLDGTTTWVTTPIDGLPTGTNLTFTTEDPNRSVHTNGVFVSSSRDTNSISWTGSEHERRIFGTAEVVLTTPAYRLGLRLETECIMVEGNAAVYGGIVTEVLESTGNPPPFGVNWRFYFKVIDSEGGNSTGYDQISNTRIFASPRSQSLCDVYTPNDRIWSVQGYEDVRDPGFVEVWAIGQ